MVCACWRLLQPLAVRAGLREEGVEGVSESGWEGGRWVREGVQGE